MSAGPCCDLHGRNCEPPSELCCGGCTEARHAGWQDERGIRRYGHPHGEICSNPDLSGNAAEAFALGMNLASEEARQEARRLQGEAADTMGRFLASMLGTAEPPPGPPYVHTLAPPPQPWYSRSGKLVYRPPVPRSYTLTQRPIAEVVAEAGFGPVPERIEITAEFCQCPACRAMRCEP